MLELLKLIFNVTLLRDSMRKGEMTAGVWAGAFLFLLAVCIIGIPTVLYYNNHPDAPAKVMIEAAVALAVVLIIYFWLAIRWRLRLSRAKAQS